MLRCGEVHRVGMQVNSGAVVAASADRVVRVPVVSEKVVRERAVRERVVLPRAARKRVVRSGEGLAGVVLVREEASGLVAVDPEVRVSVVVADFRVAAVVSEAALGMVLVEAVRAVGVTVGVLAGRPAAASFQACGRPRGAICCKAERPVAGSCSGAGSDWRQRPRNVRRSQAFLRRSSSMTLPKNVCFELRVTRRAATG